jgi:hypothetical protein
MNLSLTEAETALKQARKVFWHVKKNAKALRQTFLERRVQEIAEEKDQKTAAVMKQLILREQQRDSARKIKFALNKIGQNNITTLLVKEHGRTLELTDKFQIDEACLSENRKKYTQTEGTISSTEPIKSLLGKYGETQFCENVLDGSFQYPRMSAIF